MNGGGTTTQRHTLRNLTTTRTSPQDSGRPWPGEAREATQQAPRPTPAAAPKPGPAPQPLVAPRGHPAAHTAATPRTEVPIRTLCLAIPREGHPPRPSPGWTRGSREG